MEKISYGVVDFECIHTHLCLCENVRSEDKTTYLHTRWHIDVTCRFAPADNYTAYKLQAGVPAQDNDQLPGTTHNSIRQYLQQPRRRLVIQAGGATILDVPSKNPDGGYYPTDAMNGPFCEVVAISEIIGLQQFVVRLRFTAHTNEFDQEDNYGNLIVSNRWIAVEDIDDLCYPTRSFMGEAILRSDFMQQINEQDGSTEYESTTFNADSIRNMFFFPCANNFQRQNVRVELSSDGTRVNWSFDDVGRCFNTGENSPVRRFEAYQNFAGKTGSIERARAQSRLGLYDGPTGVASGFAALSVNRISNFFGSLNGGANNGDVGLQQQMSNLPRYQNSVSVELWGFREVSRKLLTRLALGVCFYHLNYTSSTYMMGSMSIAVQQALHEKFVAVQMTMDWSDDLIATLASSAQPSRVWGSDGMLRNFSRTITSMDTIFGGDDKSTYIGYTDYSKAVLPIQEDQQKQEYGYTPLADQRPTGTKKNPSFAFGCRSISAALIVPLIVQILHNPNASLEDLSLTTPL